MYILNYLSFFSLCLLQVHVGILVSSKYSAQRTTSSDAKPCFTSPNWQLVFTKPTADFVLFVFVMCLVYTMLPVSLDCPFLIASSVFSNACVLVPWYDTEILTLGSCSIWLLFCLVDPSVQCSLCCAISYLHLEVHLWSFLWEHALF